MQREDASTTSSSCLEERPSDDTPSSSGTSSSNTTSHSDNGDTGTTTSSRSNHSSMAQSEEDINGGDGRSEIHALNTVKDKDGQVLSSFLDQFPSVEQILMESAEKEGNDEKTVLYAIDYIANSS